MYLITQLQNLQQSQYQQITYKTNIGQPTCNWGEVEDEKEGERGEGGREGGEEGGEKEGGREGGRRERGRGGRKEGREGEG